jgi:hypothetical protein
MTGGQAVQMAKAGLKAIYVSGWQVAADANLSGQTYPDQSLYPADSAPALVRRLDDLDPARDRELVGRDALADAVVALLEDEDRRRGIGAAARRLAVERYSWGGIARRLKEIYEQVAA